MDKVKSDRELTRRIIEEHHTLQGLLRTLHRFVAGESLGLESVTNALERQLRDLREHLVSHFELEEQGGLFERLVARQPKLDGIVRDLRQDHSGFLESTSKLLRRLELSSVNEVKALRAAVGELLEKIEEHEAAENRLLQGSYFDESGKVD